MKKFLLADDDADDIDLFIEALQSIDESIELTTAINGKEALRKLTEINPEIIFLDINMPEMDGWECLLKIKNTDRIKQIPVVMLSTSSISINGKKAIQAGAFGYLEKPTSYVKLKDFLEELSKATQDNLRERMRAIEMSKAYNFVTS